MEIRLARKTDLPRIMEIIYQAQEYFRGAGIDQWQNHYPNEETILADIERQESYVLEDEDQVVGTFMCSFRDEPTYEKIYDGAWLTDGPSGVIHRVAMDNRVKGKGYGGAVVEFMVQRCLNHEPPVYSLRGDTHADNHSMQRLFAKNGYRHCGRIYLADGAERMAFEKVLG